MVLVAVSLHILVCVLIKPSRKMYFFLNSLKVRR